MKLIKRCIFGVLAAAGLCLGGEAITNRMATTEATRVISHLRLGATQDEVDRFLQTNHLAATYTLSVSGSPRLDWRGLLSDGCWLALQMFLGRGAAIGMGRE